MEAGDENTDAGSSLHHPAEKNEAKALNFNPKVRLYGHVGALLRYRLGP
jgi:hypothetical protein